MKLQYKSNLILDDHMSIHWPYTIVILFVIVISHCFTIIIFTITQAYTSSVSVCVEYVPVNI